MPRYRAQKKSPGVTDAIGDIENGVVKLWPLAMTFKTSSLQHSFRPRSTCEVLMKTKIQFALNGKSTTLEVPNHRLLLDLLRDEIGLTGTKEGCGTGDCGDCTGYFNGKLVKSCLVV